MPIKKLDLSYSRVNNLSVLNAKSLEELNLEGTPITSLIALKNNPLRKLKLCDHWVSLHYLKNIPTLEEIMLPEGIYEVSYLKKLGLWEKCVFRTKKSVQ